MTPMNVVLEVYIKKSKQKKRGTAPCFSRVISYIVSFVHLWFNLKYFTKLLWRASLREQH